MQENATVVLQKVPLDRAMEKAERLAFIPALLFLLILEASYLGVVQFQGRNFVWIFALVLLTGSFFFACVQLKGEIRKKKKKALKVERELAEAREQIAQAEEALREISEHLSKAREERDSLKEELTKANEVFDNYSLQLEITESELKALKSESEAILANVKQGVFLINETGTIGTQYSEELKNIFQIADATSRNFMRLLRPLIPEKRHQTIGNYIQLLFNPKKNAKQLQRFNPLKCVELNFQRPEGGFAPKFVEFNFQRVLSGERISQVLVTAVDVSERIELESKLREGEERREKQLELLCDLLYADNAQLRAFLKEAELVIGSVNSAFRASGEAAQEETTQEKVHRVFRMVHKLKSQAVALGLRFLEREIHQMENLLNDVRRNSRASNEDLLNVLVSISSFQARLKEAEELIEKVSSLSRPFESDTMGGSNHRFARNKPASELIAATEELCRNVSVRARKRVRIEWSVQDFDGLEFKYQTALRDAVFQLVRNAVVHGIESPERRASLGKDPCGLITLSIKKMEELQALHMVCRDDGGGLDIEAIRSRAVRDGMLEQEEAMALSESDAYMLIFEPGFSTASSVTEDAGRGVGLDAFKEVISGQLAGNIQIESGAGRYCQFELLIPIT